MSNAITIELCAEDRARLDRIASTVEALIETAHFMIDNGIGKAEKAEADEVTEKLREVVEGAKNATDEPEKETPPVIPKTAETITAKEETTAVEPEKTVIRADLGAKVRELMTKGYKAETKEIVLSYAQTVSSVPEDKVAECYGKLVALEG